MNAPQANQIKPDPPSLLIIGPTPPPYHGVSVAIQALLDSDGIMNTFRTRHLDTADRRGIQHVDNPDLYDVGLFLVHFFKNIWLLATHRPTIFYIPISQSRIGFLRDSFFIIPALFARCHVVIHLHGGNFSPLFAKGGAIWKAYMNAILSRVRQFIVLGETLKLNFHPWAEDSRISTVPNGIEDVSLVDSVGIRNSRENCRPLRVLFLSTLLKQKGIFDLLHAIPLVLKTVKNVHFLFAGFPGNKDIHSEAMTWIQKKKLQDYVKFIGPVVGKDKSDFLSSGDLFVFPGLQQEGQPIVVLEAMRAGLPVVTTDRGCLRETVIEGETGFVVPPNSSEVLASRIVTLLKDHELRYSMSLKSRQRFEQEYTLDRHAQRIKDAILAALA